MKSLTLQTHAFLSGLTEGSAALHIVIRCCGIIFIHLTDDKRWWDSGLSFNPVFYLLQIPRSGCPWTCVRCFLNGSHQWLECALFWPQNRKNKCLYSESNDLLLSLTLQIALLCLTINLASDLFLICNSVFVFSALVLWKISCNKTDVDISPEIEHLWENRLR